MIARRRPGWVMPTALLALCAGLGWLVYQGLQAAPPPGPVAATGGAPPLDALPEETVFVMPPKQSFAAILERPLFSPTRRPPPEGIASVAGPVPTLKIDVVGIVISEQEQFALILTENSKEVVRLSAGDEFQGWTLEEIEPERVTFRRGEIEEQIGLSFDRPPPVQPKRRARERRKKQQQQKQRQQQKQQQPTQDEAQ